MSEADGMGQNNHFTNGHDEGTGCAERCGSHVTQEAGWGRNTQQGTSKAAGTVPVESLGGHLSSSPRDPGITGGSGRQGRTHLITDDSAMLSSASETTVWRAMASRVASCFFLRLFRL